MESLQQCFDEARKLFLNGKYDEEYEIIKECACNDISEAYIFMVLYYKIGLGNIEADEAVAKKWAKMGMKSGDSLCELFYLELSECDDDDEFLEVMSNVRDEADKGNVFAQIMTGFVYADGGIFSEDEDLEQAEYWFNKAAGQGYSTVYNAIGVLYGEQMEEYDKAFQCFKAAAECGNVSAQFNMSVMYYYGNGVDEDEEESFKWMNKAAENGNALAQCNLGEMYEDGTGVEEDEKKSNYWYGMALMKNVSSPDKDLIF